MKNTEMHDDVDAEEGGTGNIFGDIGRNNNNLNDINHSSNFSSINTTPSTTNTNANTTTTTITTSNTANNNNNAATNNANLSVQQEAARLQINYLQQLQTQQQQEQSMLIHQIQAQQQSSQQHSLHLNNQGDGTSLNHLLNSNITGHNTTTNPINRPAASTTKQSSTYHQSPSIPQPSHPQQQQPAYQTVGLPAAVTKNLPLLEKSSTDGNRLRSYYILAIDDTFNLPPIPSDDDYCNGAFFGGGNTTTTTVDDIISEDRFMSSSKNNNNNQQNNNNQNNINSSSSMLGQNDLSALRASRFAEIALGAYVDNRVILALELSNACACCLRECCDYEERHLEAAGDDADDDDIDGAGKKKSKEGRGLGKHQHRPGIGYELARAYFLHGVFRSFRGDMERFLKYRRVCLSKLSLLSVVNKQESSGGNNNVLDVDNDCKMIMVGGEDVPGGVEALLAAVAFHDSWAYMIHNGDEKELPDIDDAFPPPAPPPPLAEIQGGGSGGGGKKNTEKGNNNNNSNVSLSSSSLLAASTTTTVPKLTLMKTPEELKYKTSTSLRYVATNPINNLWMQGAPTVFISDNTPPMARCLDALACAVRSCVDQANAGFASIVDGWKYEDDIDNDSGEEEKSNQCGNEIEHGENIISTSNDRGSDARRRRGARVTPTGEAVNANKANLCPRNMVLSAFALLQQHEMSASSSNDRSFGKRMMISAMDAFLEGGYGDDDDDDDDDENEDKDNNDDDDNVEENGTGTGAGRCGGFTDSQIQNLLSVCNTVVERPMLLYQCGPVYHIVCNAAVLLCHFLNSMYAGMITKDETPSLWSSSSAEKEKKSSSSRSTSQKKNVGNFSNMEEALFDEVLDTFISVRKLLNVHRRKLPARLRCHGIPRPNRLGRSWGGKGAHTGGVQHTASDGSEDGKNLKDHEPFIDLGETVMCRSRACQGFVLLAVSPCIVAEKARASFLHSCENGVEMKEKKIGSEMRGKEDTGERMIYITDGGEENEFANELDKELEELGREFEMDDDALLGVLSRIISS